MTTCDLGSYEVELVVAVTMRVLAADEQEAKRIASKSRFSPLVGPEVESVAIGFPIEMRCKEIEE